MQVQPYFVADPPKRGEALRFGTPQRGRVVEGVVNGDRTPGKNRATFLRVVAHGDNGIELRAGEFVTLFERWLVISMPSSRIAAMASGRTSLGFVPALKTSKRSP